MNLIPHVKGAEEAFSIDCLHELRGMIGSIAHVLAAQILFDYALFSAVKRERRADLNLGMTERDEQAMRLSLTWQLITMSAAYLASAGRRHTDSVNPAFVNLSLLKQQ